MPGNESPDGMPTPWAACFWTDRHPSSGGGQGRHAFGAFERFVLAAKSRPEGRAPCAAPRKRPKYHIPRIDGRDLGPDISAHLEVLFYNSGTEIGRPSLKIGATMKITAEQERAVQSGRAVQVNVAGTPCILLRKDVYERDEAVDFSPWTSEEMDLLAAETADLLAGDRFDEPYDS
jgi:hypothetical protein